MGRPRKYPQPNIDPKELEKLRAKKNRDIFRLLISDLNICLSTENLSTNRCLSTAVSVFTLEKFFKKSLRHGEKNIKNMTSLVLKARNCFGLGFVRSGRIIYSSPNLREELGCREDMLGEHLSMYLSVFCNYNILEEYACWLSLVHFDSF